MTEQKNIDNGYIEEDEYHCPFEEMADDPRYLYVHVSVLYAWGFKESRKYHFLYDSKWHSAVCRDAEDGRKVRLPLFRCFINPDRMFRCNPNINWCYNDVTFFFITMKSASRVRELTIASPDKRFYKPFYWILDTIGNDYGDYPRMSRFIMSSMVLLYRTIEPFNISRVNKLAKYYLPEKVLNPNYYIYTYYCRFYFELNEQNPSITEGLKKTSRKSPKSHPLKTIPHPNLGQRKDNISRKRPPSK